MTKINPYDINSFTGPRSPDQQSFTRFQQSKLCSLKESYLSFATDPFYEFQQNLNATKISNSIPQNVVGIIQKKEERSSAQNSILTKYLLKFKIFKELAEKFSIDVVKHMIKEGALKLCNSGELLMNHGKNIKKVKILLSGEAGSIKSESETQQPQLLWQILNQVVEKVGKQYKKFKNQNTSSNKSMAFAQILTESFVMRKEKLTQINDVQIEKKIEPNTILNYLPLIDNQPKHTQTLVITKNESLIFQVGIHQFYEALFLFYNAKIAQVIKIFKKTPIFNSFQNTKLKFLIQRLQVIEAKKHEQLFKQGDISECFYLLTQGQIQISKTIEILAENPNNLYRSRAKLSKQHHNKNIKILPYVNFNGVYQYQPQQKKIVLTIINPICVFGQQEVIQSRSRQVNAKVISLTAKMYKILISDIEQFCIKLSDSAVDKKMSLINFFMLVQESITLKKVLFRQNHLAQMVLHQNKNKYESLFQDQTKKKHVRSSYGSKRNSTIQPRFLRLSPPDQVPPTYNRLNFTDFQKNQQSQTLPSVSYTQDEVKIAKMTHVNLSNELLKESKGEGKSKQIRIRNKSIQDIFNKKRTIDSSFTSDSLNYSPFQTKKNMQDKRSAPKISLQDPLFTVNYFKRQEQFEKKLVFVAKKKKLQEIYRSSFGE